MTPDSPGSLGKFLQQNKLYNYHNFSRNTLRMIFHRVAQIPPPGAAVAKRRVLAKTPVRHHNF